LAPLKPTEDELLMRNLGLFFGPAVAAALLLVANVGAGMAKDIPVVGTGDGMDVLKRVSAAYNAAHPGHVFKIPASIGSGGAIAAVGANREVIGRVARPLTANEESNGIRYTPVFYVASAFFVHRDIPVRNLTAAQLRAIFSGEITSWKDVGGPDQRIRVVRREDADSSVAIFRAVIPEFRDIKFLDRSKLAMTTQEAIDSVRDNPGAIGFGSYSAEVAKMLGVVAVNGVQPEEAAYPAKATVALIFKPDRVDDEIRRFIAYFASETAKRIITEAGARPFD
jgi:phosphate transport system substrate-binding protein